MLLCLYDNQHYAFIYAAASCRYASEDYYDILMYADAARVMRAIDFYARHYAICAITLRHKDDARLPPCRARYAILIKRTRARCAMRAADAHMRHERLFCHFVDDVGFCQLPDDDDELMMIIDDDDDYFSYYYYELIIYAIAIAIKD